MDKVICFNRLHSHVEKVGGNGHGAMITTTVYHIVSDGYPAGEQRLCPIKQMISRKKLVLCRGMYMIVLFSKSNSSLHLKH